MSIPKSTWPVMLITYNLSYLRCMKYDQFSCTIDNSKSIFTLCEDKCVPRASNRYIEGIMKNQIIDLQYLLGKNVYDASYCFDEDSQ